MACFSEPGSVSDLRDSLALIQDDPELRTRLTKGAMNAGARLVDPKLTFSQAADRAFSLP